MISINTAFAVITPVLGIFLYLQEATRKKKANLLLERASLVLKKTGGKAPINLMATRSARKYLTAASTLDHAETKIQFAEKAIESKQIGPFNFPNRFHTFEQRFSSLEERTENLEKSYS